MYFRRCSAKQGTFAECESHRLRHFVENSGCSASPKFLTKKVKVRSCLTSILISDYDNDHVRSSLYIFNSYAVCYKHDLAIFSEINEIITNDVLTFCCLYTFL